MRMKRAFKMKSKTFFIIFEGLSLTQIKKEILEGESPTLMEKSFLFLLCFGVSWVNATFYFLVTMQL